MEVRVNILGLPEDLFPPELRGGESMILPKSEEELDREPVIPAQYDVSLDIAPEPVKEEVPVKKPIVDNFFVGNMPLAQKAPVAVEAKIPFVLDDSSLGRQKPIVVEAPPREVPKVVEPVVKVVQLPKNNNAEFAISSLTKTMMAMLEDTAEIYNSMTFKGSEPMDEEEFYKTLSGRIYWSFINFLEIEKKGREKAVMPILTEDSKYLQTWDLLEKFYTDPEMRSVNDPLAKYDAYEKKFGGEIQVDSEWKNSLKQSLEHGFKNLLVPKDIAAILDFIVPVWCNDVGYYAEEEPDEEISVPVQGEVPFVGDMATTAMTMKVDDDDDDDDPVCGFCNGDGCAACMSSDDDDDPDEDDDDDPADADAASTTIYVDSNTYNNTRIDNIVIIDRYNRVFSMFEDLASLDASKHEADPNNGYHNFLKNFTPTEAFVTTNPQFFLRGNEYFIDEGYVFIVIDTLEAGNYLMGYYIINHDLDDNTLRQLDYLCSQYVENTPFSSMTLTYLRGPFADDQKMNDLVTLIQKLGLGEEEEEDDEDEEDDEVSVNQGTTKDAEQIEVDINIEPANVSPAPPSMMFDTSQAAEAPAEEEPEVLGGDPLDEAAAKAAAAMREEDPNEVDIPVAPPPKKKGPDAHLSQFEPIRRQTPKGGGGKWLNQDDEE